MRTRLFIGLAFSAAAAALAACAGLAASPTGALPLWKDFSDHPDGYLDHQVPLSATFLAPPPSPTSPRGQADLAVYRATRALQGSPRWTQAAADADDQSPAAPKAYECALGVALDIKTQPVLMGMLARVAADTDDAGRPPKAQYLRKRPFLIEDGPTCIAKEDWLVAQGSYPSGHSASSLAWALILAEIAPDRADAVMRRGLEFAESRVVCGVHYPSDIDAGRLVGAATVAALRRNQSFLTDLAAAKAELARSMAAGPKPDAAKCAAEAQALAIRPY